MQQNSPTTKAINVVRAIILELMYWVRLSTVILAQGTTAPS